MKKWHIVGLGAIIVLIAGIVVAEQMTFSTYYPAPAGRYREFSTTGKTLLATDEFGSEGDNARVGIGTTNPNYKLEVNGFIGTDDIKYIGAGDFNITSGSETNALRLDTGAGTTRLYIRASDGNVGIGTTDPGAKLEVSGDIISDTVGYDSEGAYRYCKINGTKTKVYTKYLTGNLGAASTNVAHGITGIDNILSVSALAYNDNDNNYSAQAFMFGSSAGNDFVVRVDGTNVIFTNQGANVDFNKYRIKIDYIL